MRIALNPVSVVFIWTVIGCGTTAGGSDGGPDAAPTDGAFDAPEGDAADASPVDAPSDGDAASIVLDGGGPFLCRDCVCDGVDHFCAHYSGGAAPPLAPLDGGFGDAGACDPDAGQSYCPAIPANCLPDPSCDCVLANMPPSCTCDLDPSGNGLAITCIFP